MFFLPTVNTAKVLTDQLSEPMMVSRDDAFVDPLTGKLDFKKVYNAYGIVTSDKTKKDTSNTSSNNQSVANQIVNDFAPFASALDQIASTLGTTAAESNRLSQQSAREAMAFEAEQAALNREFQLRSQDRAAAYNSEQAATQRAFDEYLYNKSAAYNAAEAQKNRDWQQYMSNTSYQRAMEDMRAAGLNPILAYSQGGASNGSGATASISGGSSGGMASLGTLSGSMASGRAASMRSDASAQDLFTDVVSTLVYGITGLLSSGLSTVLQLTKLNKFSKVRLK